MEAFKWYYIAALQHDAAAQNNVGFCYMNSRGVEKDEAEAVKWYFKAAAQNWAVAQHNLGFCYENGFGIARDQSEAIKWYRMAAAQNLASAQANLGLCYANGRGVEKDVAEAVKWYFKAAAQNWAIAQHNLGFCYENGFGVAQDQSEAIKWYRIAAKQDFAPAQTNLGLCYANGRGVAKDEAEAANWYRQAAEQNRAAAQYNLGCCYADGLGVAINYVEAYKWLLLSAGQGLTPAKNALNILESRMTREQIAEGEKLAGSFKPRDASPDINYFSDSSLTEIRRTASGTGFLITDDGYFVTCLHVSGNDAQVRLVTSAGLLSARVVKVDKANDLALLKAEGKFTALPVAASRGVRLGATAATVGFPNIGLQGFAPKLAKGEIASLSGAQDDARHFQISAPIQPGNSGGALVDERGNVIGVVVAKLSQKAALATSGTLAENVNYAVKSSYLLSFLESVPEVAARLKEPNTKDRKFEDVVRDVEQATVPVLVY